MVKDLPGTSFAVRAHDFVFSRHAFFLSCSSTTCSSLTLPSVVPPLRLTFFCAFACSVYAPYFFPFFFRFPPCPLFSPFPGFWRFCFFGLTFPVAEPDSCTTAACEANASEEDSGYISENSLTLYCDEKCFDTPEDPFGGLWCNMRGLGQPCRACRADK